MPTTSPFKNLFGRNPFSALQKHMRASFAAVELVPDLFEALEKGDRAAVEVAKDKTRCMRKLPLVSSNYTI